VLRDGRN